MRTIDTKAVRRLLALGLAAAMVTAGTGVMGAMASDGDEPVDPMAVSAPTAPGPEDDTEVPAHEPEEALGDSVEVTTAPPSGEDASEEDAAEGSATDEEPTDEEADEAEEASALAPMSITPFQAGPGQTTLRVTKGGDRSGESAAPLAGATFYAVSATRATPPAVGSNPTTVADTCTTDATGSCDLVVPNRSGGSGGSTAGYWVVEAVENFTDDSGATWERIDAVAAGGGVSDAKVNIPYRFFTGNVSGEGNVHDVPQDSSLYVNPASSGTTNTKLGSHWVDRRSNPAFPMQCGLSIAMVFDMSASMDSSRVTDLKEAANAFVAPGALGGTPSTVDMFQFSTTASKMTPVPISLSTPQGTAAAQAAVNGLPGAGQGYTNWDHALRLVAGQQGAYDLVVFITDGDPTAYGTTGSGLELNPTVARNVEHGALSANAVKAEGTRMLALGVGMTTNSYLNLQAISGETEEEDYFDISDFEELAALLQNLATANCGGTLTVVKEVLDVNGDPVPDMVGGFDLTAHTPEGDYLVSPEGLVDTVTATTDDDTGAVNFSLDFTGQPDYRTVQVTEAEEAGFDFQDASCTADGQTLEVDPLDNGFEVDVPYQAIVSCTITNLMLANDLVVTKTATPSLDRVYTWDIDKVAPTAEWNIPEGETANVPYEVEVTAVDRTDSGWQLTGEITVTNPNAYPLTGVTVADSAPGLTCEVTDGSNITVEPGVTALSYTCTSDTPPSPGTNTATATWSAAAYPGTSGSATGTASFDFAQATVTETDRYITVEDSLEGELGELDWEELGADGTELFEYSREFDGVPGECTTYDNTATIVETDQSDSAQVQVCVGMDLTVDKTLELAHGRSFDFDLTKSVDETTRYVDDEGNATFEYAVLVTDGPQSEAGFTASGQITVSNPNTWPVVATVTDELAPGDAECAVDGGADVSIPASGSMTFDYACTFAGVPELTGSNTATVTWDQAEYFSPNGTATDVVQFTEQDWDVTESNRTVTVVDDKTDPANPVELGTVTWTEEGTQTEFTYSLTLAGTPGECVDFTNTAWVDELPDLSDESVVEVCWPLDLAVSKTADASFDRAHHWFLAKDVDRTEVTVEDGESASFDYVVTATPDGFTDSGWILSGDITVTNPNSFTEVVATVGDLPELGTEASCTVTPTEVTVPAGGTAVVGYECTVEEQPEYTGGTNTATVTWTPPGAQEQVSVTSSPVDVVFEPGTETDREVDVYDDQVTGEAPGELLGTAVWNAEGQPTVFEYTLAFEGVAGECDTYTNTASIPATGAEDSVDVTVCAAAPPVPPGPPTPPVPPGPPAPPVPPGPPVIPTGDPVASGPDLGLLLGGSAVILLGLLGGVVALRRLREE